MSLSITYRSNVPSASSAATEESVYSTITVKPVDEAFLGSYDAVAEAKSYYGNQCIFKEWNTSADGTGTAYAAGDVLSSSVTIYAIWQADTIKPETLDFVTPGALYQLNNLTDAERTKIANAITQSQVQEYDAKDFSDWQEWVSGTSYVEGDKVKVTDGDDVDGYICIEDNSSSTILSEEWETATCFPEDGEADTLYIDKSANTSYYWNGTEYVSVGGEYAVFTGATSSAAGTAGLVPAPSAGYQTKVLMGDGTWNIAPGARIVISDATVTNTSGAYSEDFEDENITEDMVAMRIEFGTPSVFHGNITVTPGEGEFTVACPSVSGTSTVKVYFAKQQQNPTQITSTEFDILNNRLLAVENVCTTTPVTIATTDWTLSSGTYSYTWESSLITAACGAEVLLQDGAESAGISGFNVEKVTGGIQLTTTETPTGNLPVIFKVINTKSDEIQNLTGDDIASDAISGCSNVDDALTNLDGRLGNVPSGKTAQGQIDTLNSNMIPLTSPKAFAGGTQPTLTNGTHYSNGCYYWKFGCLLYLYVSVQFTSNPSNTTIFTLPEGYRPVSASEITVSGGGSYNAKAQCQIGTDGNVKVTSVDKWVVGSGILLMK